MLLLISAAFAAAPPAPTLSSPVDGQVIADHTPQLSWYEVDDPDGSDVTYDVEITDAAGASIESAAGLTGDGVLVYYDVVTELDEDVWYCFTVVATDGDGESSDPSAENCWFSNVTNDAPSEPAFVGLADGDVIDVTAGITIDNGVDPEDRGEDQELELLDASTRSLLESTRVTTAGVGTTDWSPSLSENGRYIVRARADDGTRVSDWVEVSVIASSVNDAPPAPVLLRPRDGSRHDVAPELVCRNSVDPEDDPVTYTFIVLDAEGAEVGSESGIAEGASSTAWQAPELDDGTYTWTAIATDDSGEASPASESWTFYVGPEEKPDGPSVVDYAGYQGGWACTSVPARGAGWGLLALAGLLLMRRRQ